jgi:hypothetical protein
MDQEWKWWIIRSENTLPQMWSIITNFLTIYALFVTPVVVVFPMAGDYLEDFELFVDICFAIDIVMSFVRLLRSPLPSSRFVVSFIMIECSSNLTTLQRMCCKTCLDIQDKRLENMLSSSDLRLQLSLSLMSWLVSGSSSVIVMLMDGLIRSLQRKKIRLVI